MGAEGAEMTFEEALKTHLQSDTGIAALVGERIAPLPLPQDSVKPAISYQTAGDELQTDLDGLDGSMNKIRVQLDCWASSAAVASQLAELVRIRMQTASANFKAVPLSGFEDYESKTKLTRRSRDYSCWYRIS